MMFPILFEIDSLVIYSYPFFIGLALGIYYLIFKSFISHKYASFNINVFFLLSIISSWIGAKLLFLITSTYEIKKIAFSSNFWFGGGLVFYGALIGFFIFSYIYIRKYKGLNTDFLKLLIPGIPFAHSVGRIGCFLTGCCFGESCSLPWSIRVHGVYRHPVQLYEAILLFLLGIFLYKKTFSKSFYNLLSFYLIGYSTIRFFLEFYRGDLIRGIFLFDLSTSQLISIVLFTMGIIINIFNKNHFTR